MRWSRRTPAWRRSWPSRRSTSRCSRTSSGENGEPGAPARCRALPGAPPPGIGASGLPSRLPALLHPALPQAGARVRAAPRRAHERVGRPPSALRLPAHLGALRGEGFRVNRKRVERLWRLEGHRVPPRRSKASGKKGQRAAANAAWNLAASHPNQIWSYDFMSGRTREGALLRILNVVDEYTRLALGCRVDRSIGAREVISELEQLFERHGKPELLRSDNGPLCSVHLL